MTTTQDLNSFHQFALGRINNDDGAPSFLELATQWQMAREHDEVVGLIRACIPDMEAGRGTPISEAAEEIRRELGFSSRDS